MKKKLLTVSIALLLGLQLVACSLQPTCKAEGCDETEIYQDGYCKYHYYMQSGSDFIKNLIN